MTKQDWKIPFHKLKDQLQTLYDANQNVHHGVVMAPFHSHNAPDDFEQIIGELEAADVGKFRIYSIRTPGAEEALHAHYFYGDNGAFQSMCRSLSGIEGWMRDIPKNLVPKFAVPQFASQTERDLVRWVGLVYYLAWEFDTPYLSAMVEYNASMKEVSFFPWIEWPQPAGFDPRPFLIHRTDPYETIEDWKEKFAEEEEFYYLPEIIDAYLLGYPIIGEFVACSLTAIDCLIYMLEPVHGDREAARSFTKPIRKKPSRSNRMDNEVMLLKGFLRVHHDPKETGEKAFEPLTAEQIAVAMNWVSKSGKPLQAKVSRRMTDVFGKDAMRKYRRLIKRDIQPGFRDVLDDGTVVIEAIDYREPEIDLD